MTDLKVVALGDCVRPVKTWNPLKTAGEDEFTYIDLSAVDQERKQIVEARNVACSEAPSRARQLVEAGDVLVSTVRPNLNGVALVGVEHHGATASTGFCVLRPTADKLDGGYAFQWVKSPSFVADMVSKATGASYPAVSDRIIFESRLPLPPLPEQRRIAVILDQADALRAKRRESLAQLESLTQALFVEMTQQSSFGVRRMRLEDAMAAIIDYRGKTPTKTKSGVPLVTARVVKSGELLDPSEYIAEEDYKTWMRRGLPMAGDVLFTTEAPLGEVAQLDSRRVALAQRLLLLRGKPELLDNTYLKLALSRSLLNVVG